MNFPTLTSQARPADITLLLEGTYPYVRGGVSSWVHQMLLGLGDLRFAIIFLGSRRQDYDKPYYTFPANLVHFEEHYILEATNQYHAKAQRGNPSLYKSIESFYTQLKNNQTEEMEDSLSILANAMCLRASDMHQDFLYSKESWDAISHFYNSQCPDISFLDYLWTVRTSHASLFYLAEIASKMPRTRLLHAISTGYAGFLGVIGRKTRGTPLILTEHGVYTKERRIDLAQAQWINENHNTIGQTFEQHTGYIRQMWINFFESLGKMAYNSSYAITSLYQGNSERQQLDGADPKKCQVIPVGIDVKRYTPVYAERKDEIPMTLGLIGRVVPIKDIKTFIRSMRIVIERIPEAQGWIVGPEEEDKKYAWECKSLVSSLGMEEKVKFLGFQRIDEIMPQLGLVILSSISEAQPLVVLEGFASGVPAVTTDVGSCSQLIYGAQDVKEDQALGAAGQVVPIANPTRLAEASIRLLKNRDLWKTAQRAGLQRVKKYYDQNLMFNRYNKLYEDNMLDIASIDKDKD